ncbi:cell death-inducing p53-target protein 1 homolog [Pomacea canaliculata]|nr:cell death-inducing p53-target protein 1 homolog [Pomacea canaliculata]
MAANNKVEPGVPPPPQYTPYPPQVGQGPAYGAQPGYPPHSFVPMGAQQQSMNNTVVVTGQPTYVPLIVRYGEGPIMVTCPHCHATVTTSTHYTVGTFAWLICVIILLLGFWLGCCLIPFCVDSCKDVIHTCPNCQQQLGKFNRM